MNLIRQHVQWMLRQLRVGRSTAYPAAIVFCFTSVSSLGALVSVDWDNSDSSPDGEITGSLGGIVVTVENASSMVAGARNGGRFLATDWSTNLGSNDVSGISDPGVLPEGATLDLGGAGYSTTTITFSQPVTDPIMAINFIDDRYNQWLFSALMPLLVLLDQNEVSPIIGPGNQVTVNATDGNNTPDSGFAIQFDGSFSSISFDSSGLDGLTPQSVGFTLLADPVPEASTAVMLLAGVLMAVGHRRRTPVGH